MANRNVIPTPWAHKLRRFRYSAMPLLSFIGCVVLMMWMWQRQGRQPNAVGEVEAVRVDVAVGTDGLLMPLPHGPWTLFDSVQSGQLLARLDDRPVRTQLETLRGELARLRKEVGAAEVQLAFERAEKLRDHQQEVVRLTWQAERCRLDVLDRRAQIEGDRIDLKRREMELEFLGPLEARADLSEFEIVDRRLRRDEAAKRIAEANEALAEAETQWQTAKSALSQYPPLQSPEATQLLAPLEAAAAVQESRIREVELGIDALDVRAPIGGLVCAIHRRPGQRTRAGDPLLTLAADQGRFLVSYVRQEQGFRPCCGMPVAVRPRLPGTRSVETVIERVGPQVELVPPHCRRDPGVEEWGLPVRILPPEGLSLRPGELVDIMFRPWSTEESG